MPKKKTKKGHRPNPKRSRAAKKAYKKSGLYKHNMRKKHKAHGKKHSKRKSGKHKAQHKKYSKRKLGFLGAKERNLAKRAAKAERKAAAEAYKALKVQFVARGYSAKQATHAAKRLVRMRKSHAAYAARPVMSEAQMESRFN